MASACPCSAEAVRSLAYSARSSWPLASACLDETWFLDLNPQVRLARLIARHEWFGTSPEAARRWAEENDERNARLVEATAGRADVRLHLA